LFQESGYALKAGKRLMLFREVGVELPALQGDLEYIPYDPEVPDVALGKAVEMLTQLIAENAGIEVGTVVSTPEPRETSSGEGKAAETMAASAAPEVDPFMRCLFDLLDAQNANDAAGIDRAEEAGLEAIRAGGKETVDETGWRSWCLVSRARIGRPGTLEQLQHLSTEHPTHPAPYTSMAEIAVAFGEHEIAGRWYLKAVEVRPSEARHRIAAAKEFRAAKRIDLAREQLELVLSSESDITDALRAECLRQMFWLYQDQKDPIAAFCVGEAALQLQPNDLEFRFRLAYAYADATGGYAEHNYNDLALFHYQLLVRRNAEVPDAENNLGVVCNHFGAPIHAAEHFKASSTKGNALATANVMRQYLRAGFVTDAAAWAEIHKGKSDDEGHIAGVLGTLHSARVAEKEKLAEAMTNELSHRSTLASFANPLISRRSGLLSRANGIWQFPLANLTLSSDQGKIIGEGWGNSSSGKISHRLNALDRGGLWRFERKSRKEGDYAWSSADGHSYGFFAFSDDGTSLSVLEYLSDSSIAVYSVPRLDSQPQQP
jgi:tetratricopeptide (TPR) repeat protein